MQAAQTQTTEMQTLDGISQIAVVRESLEELEALASLKHAAADRFSSAIKEVAKRANLDPGVLSAYVSARERGKYDEWHRKQGQMELLLEVTP